MIPMDKKMIRIGKLPSKQLMLIINLAQPSKEDKFWKFISQ